MDPVSLSSSQLYRRALVNDLNSPVVYPTSFCKMLPQWRTGGINLSPVAIVSFSQGLRGLTNILLSAFPARDKVDERGVPTGNRRHETVLLVRRSAAELGALNHPGAAHAVLVVTLLVPWG